MYLISETTRCDSSLGGTRIFKIQKKGASEFTAVTVWWDMNRPFCHACSGPLTAMSSSCNHASALRRHMNKRARP